MGFAITAQSKGWNVHTTGMVLIVVGEIAAVLSIVHWASWGGLAGTELETATRPTDRQPPGRILDTDDGLGRCGAPGLTDERGWGPSSRAVRPFRVARGDGLAGGAPVDAARGEATGHLVWDLPT
jgi:hypothetical protein